MKKEYLTNKELAYGVRAILYDIKWDTMTIWDVPKLCIKAEKKFGLKGRIMMLSFIEDGVFYRKNSWKDEGFKPNTFIGSNLEKILKNYKDTRRKFNMHRAIKATCVDFQSKKVVDTYLIRPGKHHHGRSKWRVNPPIGAMITRRGEDYQSINPRNIQYVDDSTIIR